MQQRGRKSAAAITAAMNVTGKDPRLTAPATLTTAEQKLFNDLTAACDASHFRKSDIPLLTSFVQASLIAEAAAHDPKKIVLWEKAVRMLATLATRLRLSPQSRIDPKTVGRQQVFPGLRKPWEDREPWEDDREHGPT